MKTILLLRHAKSDWSAEFTTDEQRPLSERGRRATGLLGRHLAELALEPDQILSSPAVRALDTAVRVADAAGWDCPVQTDRRFYESSVDVVLEVCRKRDASVASLLLVGHQPVWSDLASALAGGGVFEMPTAALLKIDLPIKSWHQLDRGMGAVRWSITPKQLERPADQ